jgi:hypothetical protein
VPLYLYYMLRGMVVVAERVPRVRAGAILAVFLVAATATYATRYANEEYGPIQFGITPPDVPALFEWVRENTREDDVFVFYKPRVLAFFTGRRAAAFHKAGPEGLRTFFCSIGTDIVIDGRTVWRQWDSERDFYLPQMIDAHPEWFSLRATVGRFDIYDFKGCEGRTDG